MSTTKKLKSNPHSTTEEEDIPKGTVVLQEKDAQAEIDGPIVPEPFFENWRNTPPLTGQARLDAIARYKEFIASQAGRYPAGYEVDMSRD